LQGTKPDSEMRSPIRWKTKLYLETGMHELQS